jgi:NMD protein affecting ribosome stability and mRNA decay
MNTMLRNCALGVAFAASCGSASATSITTLTTPAGSEMATSLDASTGAYQVVYSLNICPLSAGDVLVVTSESQMQNSATNHDIYVATRLERDTTATTTGTPLANQGNGTNIAPNDYRLVSPKVSIYTMQSTDNLNQCVVNYIARATSTMGGTVDVIANRGQIQVLKITP